MWLMYTAYISNYILNGYTCKPAFKTSLYNYVAIILLNCWRLNKVQFKATFTVKCYLRFSSSFSSPLIIFIGSTRCRTGFTLSAMGFIVSISHALCIHFLSALCLQFMWWVCGEGERVYVICLWVVANEVQESKLENNNPGISHMRDTRIVVF